MKSTSSLSLAAHGRDLRIDFARGLALWFILVDHIPHNIVALLTIRNFGFSGAIDVFVFVSGYAAAIQYGKMTLERGFVVAATRIIKRAWQLYAAHLVLFVIYISAVSWVAERYRAPDIVEEYRISRWCRATSRRTGVAGAAQRGRTVWIAVARMRFDDNGSIAIGPHARLMMNCV